MLRFSTSPWLQECQRYDFQLSCGSTNCNVTIWNRSLAQRILTLRFALCPLVQQALLQMHNRNVGVAFRKNNSFILRAVTSGHERPRAATSGHERPRAATSGHEPGSIAGAKKIEPR